MKANPLKLTVRSSLGACSLALLLGVATGCRDDSVDSSPADMSMTGADVALANDDLALANDDLALANDDLALAGADLATVPTVPSPPVSGRPLAQPSYMARSTSFAVRMKAAGSSDWKDVDCIADPVSYDYAALAMGAGTVQLEVTFKTLASIGAYRISPIKNDYKATVAGNKLTFTTPRDMQLIVSANGVSERLVVVADPPFTPPPVSGPALFDVTRYGADASGAAWSTSAFEHALAAASAVAGVVSVPAGQYKVGNLELPSNITLYLGEAAALYFTGNESEYRLDWTTKGHGTRWIKTAVGATNIKLWGPGTIDGNALHRSANFNNNNLVLDASSNVAVAGVIIRGATKWGTMVGKSNHITFDRVKFFQNVGGGAEDDGIDVIESQFVTVTRSIAIGWDDPYSIKTYNTGSKPTEAFVAFGADPSQHQPASDITFDEDIAWTGCQAFKVGQGSFQDQKNITFKNSVVYDASHAIMVDHAAGPGTMRDITWDHIEVERLSNSVLGRSWLRMQILPTQTGPGPVVNMSVSSIVIRDFGTDSSPINGYDGATSPFTTPVFIDGVTLTNIWDGVNHKYVRSAADAHITTNTQARNVNVIAPP